MKNQTLESCSKFLWTTPQNRFYGVEPKPEAPLTHKSLMEGIPLFPWSSEDLPTSIEKRPSWQVCFDWNIDSADTTKPTSSQENRRRENKNILTRLSPTSKKRSLGYIRELVGTRGLTASHSACLHKFTGTVCTC